MHLNFCSYGTEFLTQKEARSVFLVEGSEALLGDKKLFY